MRSVSQESKTADGGGGGGVHAVDSGAGDSKTADGGGGVTVTKSNSNPVDVTHTGSGTAGSGSGPGKEPVVFVRREQGQGRMGTGDTIESWRTDESLSGQGTGESAMMARDAAEAARF